MEKLNIKDLENYLSELSVEAALEYLYALKSQFNSKPDKLIEKYEKKKLSRVKELERLKQMYKYEEEVYLKGYSLIAGVDEVGQGTFSWTGCDSSSYFT